MYLLEECLLTTKKAPSFHSCTLEKKKLPKEDADMLLYLGHLSDITFTLTQSTAVHKDSPLSLLAICHCSSLLTTSQQVSTFTFLHILVLILHFSFTLCTFQFTFLYILVFTFCILALLFCTFQCTFLHPTGTFSLLFCTFYRIFTIDTCNLFGRRT